MRAILDAPVDTPEGKTEARTWSLAVFEPRHATALLAAKAALEQFGTPEPTALTDESAKQRRQATSSALERLHVAESTLPSTPQSTNEGVIFPMEEAQALARIAADALRLAPKFKEPLTPDHLRVLAGLDAELDYFFQMDDF